MKSTEKHRFVDDSVTWTRAIGHCKYANLQNQHRLTIKSTNKLLYDEFTKKIVNNKKPNLNEESQKLDDLRIELIKAKKIIQEYELNTVGKQQQKFIE